MRRACIFVAARACPARFSARWADWAFHRLLPCRAPSSTDAWASVAGRSALSTLANDLRINERDTVTLALK